jgi:hypothetical protein
MANARYRGYRRQLKSGLIRGRTARKHDAGSGGNAGASGLSRFKIVAEVARLQMIRLNSCEFSYRVVLHD